MITARAAAATDTDNDGLTDDKEAIYHTDPNNPDTDGDGYLDGEEVVHGYSPLVANSAQMSHVDTDGDGLNDWLEVWFHSDLSKSDTNGDGVSDFDAVMDGKSPVDNTNVKTFSKDLVVDKTKQRLYYYVDNVNILDLPASTGNPRTETPNGTFVVDKKVPTKRYVGPGYDLQNVKWNMQFKPGYYIHSAYWHNDFGKKTHSHGCVNLTEADADLLYKHVNVGDRVTITGTTPKKYVVGT